MNHSGAIQRGVLAAVAFVFIFAGTSKRTSAETIDCVHDGYVAMGGMVCNTTNSYMLPGNPDWEATEGMETFCYAFLKFDGESLPESSVQSATLQLEVICLQSGMSYPVTETDAYGTIGAYAVTADVEQIGYGTADAFRDCIAESPESVAQIDVADGDGFFPSNSYVTLDVTEIVNEWIASRDNLGLVLACKEGYMLRIHSNESTSGAGPVITTNTDGEAGDLNDDGAVDMLDVTHFIDALLNRDPVLPGIDQSRGDMDENGSVDGEDVAFFIAALTS